MADMAPMYREIAATLSAAIDNGTYGIGDQLPAIADLAKEHEVSHMTIKSALQVLRDAGLVTSRSGLRTTVVAKPSDIPPALTLEQRVADLETRVARLEQRD